MTIPRPDDHDGEIDIPAAYAIDGVTHAAVQLGEFTAHVASAGESGGEPVVLLHGWPQHWWAWRHLITALAEDGRRVICPDLRGFGWSSCPGHGYASDQFAADLRALLDALGLERVDLVGHDWGAFTSHLAAVYYPERIRRLIAMSAPSPLAKVTPGFLLRLWRYWYQQPLAAPLLGRRVVTRIGSPGNPVGRWIGLRRLPDDQISAYTGQFADPARVRASVALYRYALFTEFRRPFQSPFRRGRLTMPTLVLHGLSDRPTHPSLLQALESRADNLQIRLLDGVGHFLLDEAPELVIEATRSFLD